MEHDDQIVAAVRDSSARSLALVNDEIKALVAEIEPPPGTFSHHEEADFWLELPRTFSFTSARFELPLDMSSLAGMEPVDFLARHVTVTTSRRQLYDKVEDLLVAVFKDETDSHCRCSQEIEVQEMVS